MRGTTVNLVQNFSNCVLKALTVQLTLDCALLVRRVTIVPLSQLHQRFVQRVHMLALANHLVICALQAVTARKELSHQRLASVERIV